MGLANGRRDVRIDAPGPHRSGKLGRYLTAGLALAAVVICGGFIAFVASLARKDPPYLPQGDAIVTLTGGADRIADAVDWLAQGRGSRLLISGVNTQISIEQLAQHTPRLRSWFNCCVDIDYAARNTVGNAEETRRWAQAKGYRSLVVVTSNYHMPRALVELKRHLPDVELIAAPVVTDRLRGMRVWQDISMLRLLGQEYTKFIVAYARARLTWPAPSDHITANAIGRRA